ncbi:IS4 family transposase [Geomonas sp. RF6]|uniref:IS4 family transposase n=1 Tax=Geomonas sp. RF6 TaxID=2897342 RepID=UPI001E514AB0|nr:IS4 family transposase [Geomonas sp. RF6]UFS71147.1 IS4 family transposase [Geomonas sp. RF6]UFS71432.1 IS4 family transposase [Geomonas sp. RF6]UFS72247.1 IS4 family transposase [Geomonas sp. RF6]UFS72360.1 IS4 family transposase [Geomonas sp. RF6]
MRPFSRQKPQNPYEFNRLLDPVKRSCTPVSPLTSRGYRPLQLSFDDQLKALVYYHLQEFSSGRELIQALEQDNFAKECVAPPKGVKKSAFFEAINTRGLEQLTEIFGALAKEARKVIPAQHAELGNLVGIDGSVIDALMSMDWAQYSSTHNKAKAHVGLDLNRGVPTSVVVTDANQVERQYVDRILQPGETAVLDRGYQCNADFDQWQEDGKLFICRIQQRARKKVVRQNPLPHSDIVFYDAIVILGKKGLTEGQKELRVVGYRVDRKEYWVATNRYDLTAEQVAEAYKLRWNIETFFGWWKRYLNVYHLIARSQYGVMVQVLSGLITYLLLAIYCQEQHNERVSINRVRELRNKIASEAAGMAAEASRLRKNEAKKNRKKQKRRKAKT